LIITDSIYNHYTFKILMQSEGYDFYNLTLKTDLQHNTVDTKFLKYKPTEAWFHNPAQPYDGTVELIDSNILNLDQLLLGRSSGVCVVSLEVVWTCNLGNNHAPGEGTSCTSWEWDLDITYGSCPETIDAGDSTPGGTTSNDGGDNTGGNTVNPSGDSNSTGSTKPTKPCIGPTTGFSDGISGCNTTFSDPNNCDQLMNLIETPEIISPTFVSPKKAIINLKTALNTFNPSALEQGFALSHDSSLNSRASSVPSFSSNKIRYPNHANIFGGIHLHPNNGRAIPMFSGGDILSLLQFSNNYNNNAETSPTLFTHIVVTTQGVYAIKINNLEALQQLQPFLDDKNDANGDGVNEYKIFTERLDKPLRRFADNFDTPNGAPSDYERVFLRFINNFDGNGTPLGVDLYRANEDLNNWDKLTLNESTNTITPAPCRQN
jgi:hypothetical protein